MKLSPLQTIASAIALTVNSAVGMVIASTVLAAEPVAQATAPIASPSAGTEAAQTFETPDQAADAMIAAAEKFDVPALVKLVGQGGEDVVLTGEFAQDRERALEFAAQARTQKRIVIDAKTNRARLLVGAGEWPFALPIVKRGSRWSFDAAAGRKELFDRRIGSNELDAIAICRGFVEAQLDYAFRKREGYEVAQYAQRVIASPGKQDGLAWQNADGTWGGPVGENIARAIEQGYKDLPRHTTAISSRCSRGRVPMRRWVRWISCEGRDDWWLRLGGCPAEYGQTGLKTFIVSHTGVVYQNDFGADTAQVFQSMDRFNPDKTWTPVTD